MRLGSLIQALEEELKRVGDVDLFQEVNDGYTTGYYRIKDVKVRYEAIWKGHSQGKRHSISFSLTY